MVDASGVNGVVEGYAGDWLVGVECVVWVCGSCGVDRVVWQVWVWSCL